MRLLARHGLAAEAASALPVAAVIEAVSLGMIPEGARVAALLTSTAIKWPGHLADLGDRAATIGHTMDELRRVTAVD